MAYLTGKNGWVGINIGGTLNTTTGAISGGISTMANSSGLINVTTSSAHGLTTGNTVYITGVTGTTEANGQWTITVIDTTHFTLNGSTFTNAYVSGGVLYQTFSMDKWSLTLKCNLPNITNFTSQGFQALLAGIDSGEISMDGPYNAGNTPFTAGNQYLFGLGFSSAVAINVPALVGTIGPSQNVNEAGKMSISASSNGVFLAAIT